MTFDSSANGRFLFDDFSFFTFFTVFLKLRPFLIDDVIDCNMYSFISSHLI